MEFDLYSNIETRNALTRTVSTSVQVLNGVTVDTKGYESVVFSLNTETVAAGGAATAKIQESDDDSVWTDVSTDETLGSITIDDTDDAKWFRIGSISKKRYQRLVVTTTNAASTIVQATAILGNPKVGPVAAQSV